MTSFTPQLATGSSTYSYRLTTHRKLRLGNLQQEKASQWQVRLTERRSLATGGAQVELLTLARQHTPASGAEGLSAEIWPCLDRLLVELDATGHLIGVVNKEAVRARWATLVPELRRRYRQDPDVPPALLTQLEQVLDEENGLAVTLADSPEFRLLLPPLYGQCYSVTEPVSGSAELARFIGELALPLRTEALLDLSEPLAAGLTAVRVAGVVAEETYAADTARQALCTLTDQPNLDTRVTALHYEHYIFDSRHSVVTASRHTRAEIQGVVGQQLTVLLRTLS